MKKTNINEWVDSEVQQQIAATRQHQLNNGEKLENLPPYLQPNFNFAQAADEFKLVATGLGKLLTKMKQASINNIICKLNKC